MANGIYEERRVNRPSWDETNKKEEEEALEELRVWFAGPK